MDEEAAASRGSGRPLGLTAEIRTAFAFLTRIPVGGIGHGRVGAAVRAFPVVGIIVGGGGGLVFAAASGLGLPAALAAPLAVATTIAATGALHEDGLADTADGIFGGTDRDGRLKIMRDSRIGSFGALALGLSLLIRAGALAAIGTVTGVALALVAAGAVSRAAMAPVMMMVEPARADGLAAGAGRPVPIHVAHCVILAVAIALLCLGPASGLAALATAAAAATATAGLARRAIGGHTGDTLGAVQQAAEIGVLLAAAAAS